MESRLEIPVEGYGGVVRRHRRTDDGEYEFYQVAFPSFEARERYLGALESEEIHSIEFYRVGSWKLDLFEKVGD